MSDNLFLKVVKGAAKLGASYMASTADSLSRNSSYSDEQREQFRDMHSSFSDMKDRLSDNTAVSDYDEDYYDDCSYEEKNESADVEVSPKPKKNDSDNVKASSKPIVSKRSRQMTFAGYQWYIIHNHSSTNNTALLISKQILSEDMTFFPENCKELTFKNSNIYVWLNDYFLPKLKSRLHGNDKEKLINVSLLSTRNLRSIPFEMTKSKWWLQDIEDERYLHFVSASGHAQKVKISKHGFRCGIRPVILIKLK